MNNYRSSFATYEQAQEYANVLRRKWSVEPSIEETSSGWDVTWRMK